MLPLPLDPRTSCKIPPGNNLQPCLWEHQSSRKQLLANAPLYVLHLSLTAAGDQQDRSWKPVCEHSCSTPDTHPDTPTSPWARSKDHASGTKPLSASRKPLTQRLLNPPAWLWSRLPSSSGKPALHPQCQAQGKGALCMSTLVTFLIPSSFLAHPGGVCQPCSSLAPGGDPSASFHQEILPVYC